MNRILQLDLSGTPQRWLTQEAAAVAYAMDKVCWEIGERNIELRGGWQKSGRRSRLQLASVIATRAESRGKYNATPALSNATLFRRDDFMCMYCGGDFRAGGLTRDHIVPRVQGGKDCWSNVVSACRRCNNAKGGRQPEEAGMALLAVPFVPNIFEYMYLANRRILADQMNYLSARFSGKRNWPAA